MRTRNTINPHPDTPGGPGPGPGLAVKSRDARETSQPKALAFRWLLLIAAVALILGIIAPVALMLGMKLAFRATLESEDWSEVDVQAVLAGADSQEYKRTVSTEYSAHFVPARLAEEAVSFSLISALYGPIMITGAPIDLDARPATGNEDLSSSARLRFRSAWVPIMFVLLYVALLLVMDIVSRNHNSVLGFVVTISVLWLIYSAILWAAGDLMMARVDQILGRLFTEEQGSARFSIGLVSIFAAPVRLFLFGTLYWVLIFLFRRAKSEPPVTRTAHEKAFRG